MDNSNPTTKVVEVPSVTAQPLAAVLPTTTQTTNIPIVLIETTAPVENATPSLAWAAGPGGGSAWTLTSVATFGGSIDPAALLSAGWVPSSDLPGSFQTNTLYGAALLDPNNRTLTYSLNPSNAAVEALQFGQTLQHTVVVPTGANTSTSVTVTIDGSVHPVGQNTTAGAAENLSANLTQSVSGQLQATNSISTHLTFTAAEGASSGASHVTVQVNGDGTFSYTPNPGFYGTDTFQVQARDGSYLFSAPFTVTVNVSLAAPNATAAVVANPNSVVTGNLLANDPNQDVLTVTGVIKDVGTNNSFTGAMNCPARSWSSRTAATPTHPA